MTVEPFYKAHWITVSADRMSSYKEGFAWDEAAERLFEPAAIAEGQRVADFGCGPGKVSVALAQKVGSTGHVYALDINSEFLETVTHNAAVAGIPERISTCWSDGRHLHLEDGQLDRVSARNALMYVDDPVQTLREFHRVLKPGGLAHAIDGDWMMMVAEPVAHDIWQEFVLAAAHACRSVDMGRKLRAAFLEAGFNEVEASIVARPDAEGRLLGMVRNMARYAKESGKLEDERIDHVVSQLEEGLVTRRYLVVSPQFVVTGRKSD
jgi:ubiquinone/menaquinone biosynthesis C-methylase UbiE